MIVMLAALIAAEGSGSLLLDCTVPDRRGKPTNWSVKLDQSMGVVEVKLGQSPDVYTATATYRPESVKFDLLDASVAIDRAKGSIKRTLVELGVRNVVEGTCTVAQAQSVRGMREPQARSPTP